MMQKGSKVPYIGLVLGGLPLFLTTLKIQIASHVQLTMEEEKEEVDEFYRKRTGSRDKMGNSR